MKPEAVVINRSKRFNLDVLASKKAIPLIATAEKINGRRQ